MRAAALALALVFPLAAHAGPPEIAATLPDEASECRYLLNLCRQIDDDDDHMRALKDMAIVGQTAQVIRAKHDKMPACFRECTLEGKPMLNLERFK